MLSYSVPSLSIRVVSISSFNRASCAAISSAVKQIFSPNSSGRRLRASKKGPTLVPRFSGSITVISNFATGLLARTPNIHACDSCFAFSGKRVSDITRSGSAPLHAIGSGKRIKSLTIIWAQRFFRRDKSFLFSTRSKRG